MTLALVGKALLTMLALIKKKKISSRLERGSWRISEEGLKKKKKSLPGIWEQFSIAAAAVKSEIILLIIKVC